MDATARPIAARRAQTPVRTPFLPERRTSCAPRYHSRVTVGQACVSMDFDSLAEAQAMQDRYRSAHDRNASAAGGIFDRVNRRYVPESVWRGRSRWRPDRFLSGYRTQTMRERFRRVHREADARPPFDPAPRHRFGLFFRLCRVLRGKRR